MSNDLIPQDADHINVLHGLVRKHAEIAGQIDDIRLDLGRLIAELDHIDASIRIFNPDVDVGAIRSKPAVPPRHAALRGELTRYIFKALRAASDPLSPRTIAVEVMKARGLNTNDQELVRLLIKRVRGCLRVQKRRGLITSTPLSVTLKGWEIAQ